MTSPQTIITTREQADIIRAMYQDTNSTLSFYDIISRVMKIDNFIFCNAATLYSENPDNRLYKITLL